MVHLPTCLQALADQTFSDFETVVVDNASTDGSLDYIRETWPDVRVVALDSNRGFPAAVNAGIEATDGEYVVLLNNDTRAEPEWLQNLVGTMDANPGFAFGSSKLVRYDTPERIDSVGHAYSLWLGSATRLGDDDPADDYVRDAWIFGATAAASIYRRSLFDDVGTFDASFFFGHEDVEFDLRANVAGHRCLLIPGAIVRHKRGTTYDASTELKLIDVRNRMWAAGANLPPLALALWAGAKVARVFVWAGRRVAGRVSGRRRGEPGRTNGGGPGSPWRDVGITTAARTAAGALRALPRKRRERRGTRRVGSLELIRVMRRTRTPQPAGGAQARGRPRSSAG